MYSLTPHSHPSIKSAKHTALLPSDFAAWAATPIPFGQTRFRQQMGDSRWWWTGGNCARQGGLSCDEERNESGQGSLWPLATWEGDRSIRVTVAIFGQYPSFANGLGLGMGLSSSQRADRLESKADQVPRPATRPKGGTATCSKCDLRPPCPQPPALGTISKTFCVRGLFPPVARRIADCCRGKQAGGSTTTRNVITPTIGGLAGGCCPPSWFCA